MFKRSDDQEWTRFRGVLSKEREEAAATGESEQPVQANQSASTPAAPQESAGLIPSTAVPGRPTSDVNVGISSRTERSVTMEEQPVESLIGANTSVEGTFKCDGAVRVFGAVQGELASKSAIYVEESARITAKVTATQVTVAGRIDGQIYCEGRVEIRPTGHVTGEIHAGALIVQEGAFFEGASKMAGGEAAAATAPRPSRARFDADS